jgi:DHA1 family bicyclomycin/chloramphenicol resistance-like MFS transporter
LARFTDFPMSSSPAPRFLDRGTPPTVFTLICLSALSALTMSMFLPSLPGMAADFDAPYTLMQLSVALFLVVNAAMQPIVGPLSDKYGRRPVMLWGLLVFVIASIGCLFARDSTTFLIFRMAQAGVVVAMVLSRATIRDVYDSKAAASKIAYVTMGMSVAPMVAPAIGGMLDGLFGWRASFAVYVVGGVLCLILALADQGETKARSDLSVLRQFAEYPELLRSPRFWAFSLANAFASGCYFAFLGGGPFVGREIYGLSATQLGVYFSAPAFGYFIGNYIAGRFTPRVGMVRMMLWGTILVFSGIGTTLVLFSIGLGSKELFFFFGITSIGIGNGMSIPNATTGMISVRPNLAGTASGLGGAIMIGGGAALSAFAGTFLDAEAGPYPLLELMLASAALSMLLAYYAYRRSARMGEID